MSAADAPVLIALGANLPGPGGRSPRDSCEAALAEMLARGLGIPRRSRWYESAPVPAGSGPWYINGVAALDTDLPAAALLDLLHGIEAAFGRRRLAGRRDEPRSLDLDILDYRGRVSRPGEAPVLPHPRLAGRAFVLLPLAEVAPGWRHPVTGETVEALIAGLPAAPAAWPEGGGEGG